MDSQECLDAMMASQTLFYGGSGGDRSPIEFLLTHGLSRSSIRCFINVDYTYSAINGGEDEYIDGFVPTRRIGLHGTNLLDRYHESQNWVRNIYPECFGPGGWDSPRLNPEGYIQLFKNSEQVIIAVMFLGADGHVAYDALYRNGRSPFAFVIHDHGFGGDWGGRFGNRGACHRISIEHNIKPRYIMVAENSEPWDGYTPWPTPPRNPQSFRGGMYNVLHTIYKANPMIPHKMKEIYDVESF